jgi:chromosome segregation ATPase
VSESEEEQLKADIEATRAELAETADALAAKLDVKAQANKKVHEAGDKLSGRLAQARQTAPEPVQKAIGSVERAAQPVIAKAAEDKKRTALAVGGAVFVLLLIRRVRRR